MPNAFVVVHGRERPNFLRGRHFGEPQLIGPLDAVLRIRFDSHLRYF
jgi:hypothetical protein